MAPRCHPRPGPPLPPRFPPRPRGAPLPRPPPPPPAPLQAQTPHRPPVLVTTFLRRYPTLLSISPPPEPVISPSPQLLSFLQFASRFQDLHSPLIASKLAKLLMISSTRGLPVAKIAAAKRDFGLPDDFLASLVPRYPHLFRLVGDPGPAILAVSRAHFLPAPSPPPPSAGARDGGGRIGYVFVKGRQGGGGEVCGGSAMAEARNLHAIRTVLEDLEDHLEFLHAAKLVALV